jgi:hypothetical protein
VHLLAVFGSVAERPLMARATKKQTDWLERLFLDAGFSDRTQRNGWLQREFKRDIRYLDDLTVAEASAAIDKLRDIKEDKPFVDEARRRWREGEE